ncbi:glycerophosphoryl diester phosphodiesterase family protein [Plectosphaerella plurivora]|uniref:Glycerophosphoryl diester phosphodiesterase family protein n=1 Tax=Plectosphaerella plurivora TaxID=936078 RepID=A0A9P8VLR0_9PEZI|nr:glycerophosphoryl diester phosphodiesterase family protein [Plectosphaerella plurivora]
MPLLAPSARSAPLPPAAVLSSSSRSTPTRIPQAIAHRGYKALYPENTMLAFRSAVAVGAHALETDLHLSADGQVVLSHDQSLKRCYGIDTPVAKCDWSYLQTLRTLKAPHEPMPRLVDLLTWLAEPNSGRDKIWVLLDVKPDDAPSELLGAVARALKSVERDDGVPWEKRIVIGCWNSSFLDASLSLLPTFPVAHQSHSPHSSTRFLLSPSYPGLSFNMFQQTLVGPCGARFRKALAATPDAANRRLYVWTVNEPFWMRWAVKQGVDGVITDDPAKYLDVVGRYEEELVAAARNPSLGEDGAESASDRQASVFSAVPEPTTWTYRSKLYFQAMLIQFLILIFSPFLRRSVRWQFKEPGSAVKVPKA